MCQEVQNNVGEGAWLSLGESWADASAGGAHQHAARTPQGIHAEPETEFAGALSAVFLFLLKGCQGRARRLIPGKRAPLRAQRSSHYSFLLVPPPSVLQSPGDGSTGAVIFPPLRCSHSPWDTDKHLRGAEMKSYPPASTRRLSGSAAALR
ncbi:hypothetical protein SRHO_G00115810 [Serrasalmus rhombeus]